MIRERLRRLFVGKTERRLALVILITTMVPLGVALWIGTKMFDQASNVWFNPEIGEQLDKGVVVYQQYVKAVKDDLDHQTQAIAADPVLREAAKKRNIETVESELDALFPQAEASQTAPIRRHQTTLAQGLHDFRKIGSRHLQLLGHLAAEYGGALILRRNINQGLDSVLAGA